MNPVEATRVADRIEFFTTERPGVYFFEDNDTGLWFECPCGCGGHIRIRVYRAGTPKPAPEVGSGPAWEWDGNHDHPSLSPSIRDMNGCRFHGHLTRGQWTFEGDSGVKA